MKMIVTVALSKLAALNKNLGGAFVSPAQQAGGGCHRDGAGD